MISFDPTQLNLTVEGVWGLGAALVFGFMLIFKAIKGNKILRKIEDTPKSKVETAPQGYVEFEGFAWPQDETVRGSSGEEAVYYSLTVQKKETRGSGKQRRTEWITVFSHFHSRPFYLVDATGLALIEVGGGELDIDEGNKRSWSSLTSEEKDRILNFSQGRNHSGFPPSTFLFGIFSGSYRVIEKEIAVGNPLYANGDFRTLTAVTPVLSLKGLTEFSSRVFNRESRSLKNITSFLDKNKDGKISTAESRTGYLFAARQARMKSKDLGVESPFPVYGRIGSSKEHPLLLADLHESHLIERKGRFIWVQVAAGAAIIALVSSVVVPRMFSLMRTPANASRPK